MPVRTPAILVKTRRTSGEGVDNLAVFGEPPGDLFGKDQFPVGDDIKNAATALNERGLDSEFVFELSRQTGGLGFVVSLNTVGY